MKVLIYILGFCIMLSCVSKDLNQEEYLELCPYEVKYSYSHHLNVPISIKPNKQYYNVGDTINITSIFKDSIEDISREIIFQIKDFPFLPIIQLYKFKNLNNTIKWDNGFDVAELLIDEDFKIRLINPSDRASGFQATTIYDSSFYIFKYSIVLKESGTYLLGQDDQYNSNLGTLGNELNKKANAIEFEGRCPETNFLICSIVQGETFNKNYIDELKKFNELNFGYFGSLDNSLNVTLNYGSFPIEWSGIYIFEVLE